MSLGKEAVDQILEAIEYALIEHVNNSGVIYKSKSKEIVTVNYVTFREPDLSHLKTGDVYSGDLFTLEKISGSIDVDFRNSGGGQSHSPGFKPYLSLDEVECFFDREKDEFAIQDIGTVYIA